MARSLAIPLLLAAIFSVTAAQVVYDDCPPITVGDLGNSSAPSTDGLVADRLTAGQGGDSPLVLIFDYNIVCFAAGTVRGTYRALSVVVSYRCDGVQCTSVDSPLGFAGNATSQFEFGCVGSSWVSTVENSNLASSTFINPSNATLDTEASTGCSFCLREDARSLGGFPLAINGITHCGACHSSCPGLCTDITSTSCCNVYDDDVCAVSCPTGEAPDTGSDCVPQCPELDDPANGIVTINGTRLEGSEATYACDANFTLQGGSMRTCREDGTWSSVAPTCTDVDCGDLPSPDNGQVAVQGTTLDSIATYSCNSGYRLDGEELRMCQENGEWSESAPVCEESGGGLGGGPIAGIVIAAVVVVAIITGAVIGVVWYFKK